jgi:hypothetical protein
VAKARTIPNLPSGWWLTNPSEKYESQLGRIIPIYYGKIKNDPNHQPDK